MHCLNTYFEISLQYLGFQLSWKSLLLSLVHLSVPTQRHRRHLCQDISQIPALHYKVFKIVPDNQLVVEQSRCGEQHQYNLMISCPTSLPRHFASVFPQQVNAIHCNAMLDYTCQCYAGLHSLLWFYWCLLSAASEISLTPSKSHQLAVTDKMRCLAGPKLFTICTKKIQRNIAQRIVVENMNWIAHQPHEACALFNGLQMSTLSMNGE